MRKTFKRAAFYARPFFLFLCVCAVFFAKPVFAVAAADAPEIGGSRVFFLTDEEVPGEYENVFVFFSHIELNGEISGSVYAFFSEVSIGDDCGFTGVLRTFSSSVTYAEDRPPPGISSITGIFGKTENLENGKVVFSDSVPFYVIRISLAALGLIMCFTAFAALRGFTEQGSVVLKVEPVKVIRNGLVTYFFFIALALIFALTVFFMPLALIFILLFFAVTIPGLVSLGILIGYIIAGCVKKTFPEPAYMATGLIIPAVLGSLPFIGWVVNLLLLPVLTSGITATCLVNALINKKFYYTPYKGKEKKQFNREWTRKLILGEKVK